MPLTVVPVAGQNLVSSRDLIAGNFFAIGTMLNPATNMVTLPVTTTPATVAAATGNLYTKTVGTGVGLFWKPDTATTEIQIGPSSGGGGGANWTVLPGGIYMEWGIGVTDGTGHATITFTKITHGTSAVTTPQAQTSILYATTSAAILGVASLTDSGTTYPNVSFNWIAIGT